MTALNLAEGGCCPKCGMQLRYVPCRSCQGEGTSRFLFTCKTCQGRGRLIVCPNAHPVSFSGPLPSTRREPYSTASHM
jgi:hypothetical protein